MRLKSVSIRHIFIQKLKTKIFVAKLTHTKPRKTFIECYQFITEIIQLYASLYVIQTPTIAHAQTRHQSEAKNRNVAAKMPNMMRKMYAIHRSIQVPSRLSWTKRFVWTNRRCIHCNQRPCRLAQLPCSHLDQRDDVKRDAAAAHPVKRNAGWTPSNPANWSKSTTNYAKSRIPN